MLGHRKLETDDYLAILKRHRRTILYCVLIFPVLGVVMTRFLPKKYTSESLVLIEGSRVSDDVVKPVVAGNLENRLSSMKEQISSRSRLQPIIERYKLYAAGNPTMDDRVEEARKAIVIKPIHPATNSGGLPGFFIDFSADNAHTAQLVCGEITSLFMNSNLEAREESAEGTTDFLRSQLADAKRNLDEQDARLAAFQRQYFGKLPSEEPGNMQMLTSLNTQLEAATQQLARMEQDKAYAESMLAQQQAALAATTPPPPAPGAPATPQNLGTPAQQKELASLEEHAAELSTQYTPNYPDVKAVQRQIAELKAQIARTPSPDAAARTASGAAPAHVPAESAPLQQLRSQIRSAELGIQEKRREQAAIQARLGTYQERIQSSPQVEEEYKELTRDYNTAVKFHDDLLTKMNHSKMATDLERRQEGEQFRLMDDANLPDSPSFPKVWMFALGGVFVGLLEGLALAAIREYKDTTLRTERDVWAFTRLPTLGVISQTSPIVRLRAPRRNLAGRILDRLRRRRDRDDPSPEGARG